VCRGGDVGGGQSGGGMSMSVPPPLLARLLSWERYLTVSALLLGAVITQAAIHIHQKTQWSEDANVQTISAGSGGTNGTTGPVSVSECGDGTESIAVLLIALAAVHLVALHSVSVLRDRRLSLQHRPTLIAKLAAIAGVVSASMADIGLAAVICHRLMEYSNQRTSTHMLMTVTDSGSSTVSPTGVLHLCPSFSDPFLALSLLLVIWVLLSVLLNVCWATWLVYQRAVFLAPPPGIWEDPDEIKAVNWICTETGDVIPTLYMLPPSVHRMHREVETCILYSHGNAMDLADTVYTLRALAETFDCAVMGYEYPGYGMCSGSASEEACYAAISAAFQCLVDYHQVSPRQIILYGRSLGTGPSTHLAARLGKGLGGVILQSPFLSVCRTVINYSSTPGSSLCCDMFCSIDRIGSVQVPTLIVHGRRDSMVRVEHGEALWRLLPSHCRCAPLWMDDAGHNDMPRPWLVSEEKIEGETEEEHHDKLKRNKESRAFIARMREFIATVRAHRESVDAEEQRAKAVRRQLRERRRAESEAKAQEAGAAATSGLPASGPAVIPSAAASASLASSISSTSPASMPLRLNGIELSSYGPPTFTMQPNHHPVHASNQLHPLIHHDARAGSMADRTVAIAANLTNTSSVHMQTGETMASVDQVHLHLQSDGSSHAVGSRTSISFDHSVEADKAHGVEPLTAAGTCSAGGRMHGNDMSKRSDVDADADVRQVSASLNPPDRSHLRFSSALSPSDLVDAEVSRHHPHHGHPSSQTQRLQHHRARSQQLGGGVSTRSSHIASSSSLSRPDGLEGEVEVDAEMSLAESDGSRRPSLTDLGSIMGGEHSRLGSQIGERFTEHRIGASSQLHSLTHPPRERDRADRYAPDHSRLDMGGVSRTGMSMAVSEVSRVDRPSKAHSVAIRHNPLYGDRHVHGKGEHSPHSDSRSLSLSSYAHSPNTSYAHVSMPAHPSHIAANPFVAFSNLPPQSSSSSISNSTARTTSPLPLPLHPQASTSPAPFPPTRHSKAASTSSATSNNAPVGATSHTSPSGSHSHSHSPSPTPSPSTAPSTHIITSTHTSNATILAPNPSLVPLTMNQLQELMDALKAKERGEREKERERGKERREKDRDRDRERHHVHEHEAENERSISRSQSRTMESRRRQTHKPTSPVPVNSERDNDKDAAAASAGATIRSSMPMRRSHSPYSASASSTMVTTTDDADLVMAPMERQVSAGSRSVSVSMNERESMTLRESAAAVAAASPVNAPAVPEPTRARDVQRVKGRTLSAGPATIDEVNAHDRDNDHDAALPHRQSQQKHVHVHVVPSSRLIDSMSKPTSTQSYASIPQSAPSDAPPSSSSPIASPPNVSVVLHLASSSPSPESQKVEIRPNHANESVVTTNSAHVQASSASPPVHSNAPAAITALASAMSSSTLSSHTPSSSPSHASRQLLSPSSAATLTRDGVAPPDGEGDGNNTTNTTHAPPSHKHFYASNPSLRSRSRSRSISRWPYSLSAQPDGMGIEEEEDEMEPERDNDAGRLDADADADVDVDGSGIERTVDGTDASSIDHSHISILMSDEHQRQTSHGAPHHHHLASSVSPTDAPPVQRATSSDMKVDGRPHVDRHHSLSSLSRSQSQPNSPSPIPASTSASATVTMLSAPSVAATTASTTTITTATTATISTPASHSTNVDAYELVGESEVTAAVDASGPSTNMANESDRMSVRMATVGDGDGPASAATSSSRSPPIAVHDTLMSPSSREVDGMVATVLQPIADTTLNAGRKQSDK